MASMKSKAWFRSYRAATALAMNRNDLIDFHRAASQTPENESIA
jgi:hypothetical protein